MNYSLNFHDYLNKISKAGRRSTVNPSRFSEAGGASRPTRPPPLCTPLFSPLINSLLFAIHVVNRIPNCFQKRCVLNIWQKVPLYDFLAHTKQKISKP
jgi:hypothetical protein